MLSTTGSVQADVLHHRRCKRIQQRIIIVHLAAQRKMNLTLQSQTVDSVVVIRCQGRIVLGDEIRALQLEVGKLRQLKKKVVLQLAEVNYIDSAGLGALVRLVGMLRVGGGGLKLCELSPFVHKVLQATHLLGTIPNYASEKEAVEAFADAAGSQEKSSRTHGAKIICLDSSNDLLAYLKALLTQAGYEVFIARELPDAKTFALTTGARIVIYDQDPQQRLSDRKVSRQPPPRKSVAPPPDFSTAEASQAGADLLARLHSALSTH